MDRELISLCGVVVGGVFLGGCCCFWVGVDVFYVVKTKIKIIIAQDRAYLILNAKQSPAEN